MFFEPEPHKKTARKQILLLTQNYLDNSKNFLANGTDIGKYAVLDKLTTPPTNRLPNRDPMTREIYKKLIQAAEGPTYIHVRTRIALCILAVTGIRINELLPLKVNQLQTLIKENWIAIDRSKRGPSNHKAFLTKEGKKIINDRQKDFKFIFLMKEPDSYLFTAESNHSKQLGRVIITKDVNKIMRQVSEQLPDKPNITSHSFRIGYITQLWKDSKDIEFVKQIIGHRNLDTTSAYIKELSD